MIRKAVWETLPPLRDYSLVLDMVICWRKCTAVWMKWTGKHKNLTTASDSFVFRSGENKRADETKKETTRAAELYPNYRDMPADVSVKEPSKGSLGVVSRNHRTERSDWQGQKVLYSRRREQRSAVRLSNNTATSDSTVLLFFLPILMIRKQGAGK